MPIISWNEVRDRALQFAREWASATSESAEKQTFWNEFFEVFGLRRRHMASFEERVRNIRGQYGFIDVFVPGMFLVEHKSAGKSLDSAASQAFAYTRDLIREGRHNESPRYILVSDFENFALYDLEPEDDVAERPCLDVERRFSRLDFRLFDLHKHVRDLAFIRGEQPLRLDPEDPANLKATQLLADLHDALEEAGYTGHALERYLVRVLFCLFAEDTGIFEPGQFTSYIKTRTREDGSDLGQHLGQLFEVLDSVEDRRMRDLDEDLAAFPYVNGGLFAERLPFVSFRRQPRKALLECCDFQWARISPAIFGSLFQGVMVARERRQIGAHYTSERDILKVLRGLFLDDLQTRLDTVLADRSTRRGERLREFLNELRRMRVFDPACGSGNFLILAYRELRRLETCVLVAIHGGKTLELNVRALAQVDVDQFYGIEILEWPVRIAEVGLWLTDHQCNLELAKALGQSFRRLPLKATPTLHVDNALRSDWRAILPPTADVVVLGNPPFVGKHYQSVVQRADMAAVFGAFGNAGDLDYVSCWFVKAAQYARDTRARCAFVSTNSLCQGEQVPVLWGLLFNDFSLKIHFAHRTFRWTSEARGKAHVHVVIIGFGSFDVDKKQIFEYAGDDERPACTAVANISPYLTAGPDRYVTKARSPLCDDVPEMRCGNKPSDGGNLIFTDAERSKFLRVEPAARPFFRRFTGSEEFINGEMRWCLWLKDADPRALRSCPQVLAAVEQVRKFRLESTAAPTRAAAGRPAEFFYISQPDTEYIAIPEVSSERRRYIPIGYLPPSTIASNKIYVIAAPSLFVFGMLSSAMHMAWVRVICGRLKSDYQYSGSMVYNTFPWPAGGEARAHSAVETAAQAVLDARAAFPTSTLADLYDPRTMPPALAKAHAALDRAVDRCYKREKFVSDQARFEHLFRMYGEAAEAAKAGAKKVAEAGAKKVAKAGAKKVAEAGAKKVAKAGAKKVAKAVH